MSEEVKSTNGRQTYISWKLPFDMEVKFGGREVFTIIVLFLLATPILYILLIHDQKMEQHMISQTEAQEATTYVLTLSQEERQKLNLAKPKRIREMERN